MMLATLTILISLYIIYESLDAVTRMPEGLRRCFCHKVKYVLAFGSALVFIRYALVGEDLWLVLGSAGTLAWFIWPRTIWRFEQWMDDLEEMEGS